MNKHSTLIGPKRTNWQAQTPPSTVFYVDDDSALCQSVTFLLQAINLQIETFDSADQFLETYKPGTPGCLLLDVRMPTMSGLELQAQLRKRNIAIPIIFITGHGDVPMATQAMKAGAIDFLTKPFHDQTLIDCIQKVLNRDDGQRQYHLLKAQIAERVSTLTPREIEVMRYVVKGDMNKMIAYTLGIASKTVELHRAHVMEKMYAKSLAHLVKLALIHDGITEPETYYW